MKQMRITATLLVLGALASGCSSNSLREGTWKLSIEALDSRTGESMKKYFESNQSVYHHVNLNIEWSDEKEEEFVEITGHTGDVRVHPRESHAAVHVGLEFIYGLCLPGLRRWFCIIRLCCTPRARTHPACLASSQTPSPS